MALVRPSRQNTPDWHANWGVTASRAHRLPMSCSPRSRIRAGTPDECPGRATATAKPTRGTTLATLSTNSVTCQGSRALQPRSRALPGTRRPRYHEAADPVPVVPDVGARRALVVEGDAAMAPGHPSPVREHAPVVPAVVPESSISCFKKAI